MSVSVSMPQLGESVTEGTVTRWLKKEGERVEADEPLLEVSTDKVDTEIPSPASGILRSIAVDEDETVAVGAQLAVIEESSDNGAAPAPAADAPAATDPYPAPAPAAQPYQPAAPAYEAPAPAPVYQPPAPPAYQPTAPAYAAAPAAAAPAAEPYAPAEQEPAEEYQRQTLLSPSADAPYVTPLVRKLAAEHAVSLEQVNGTGVGGRIRKQDVIEAARSQRAAAAAAAAAAPASAPAAAPALAAEPAATAAPASAAASAPAAAPAAARAPIVPSSLRGTTQKLSRPRQVIAQRMMESLHNTAQLTTVVEVDVTAIARLRGRAKRDFEAREGVKLSFLPFFALAAIEALKVHPKLNAVLDGDQVTYHDAEHLGVAVDTERGLMVPVIHNAGDLNIGGLTRKIGDLAQRTRSGQVSPDELAGGTFTLTNTGSRGALFDTPILNQPQVAILGTGTVVKRAVVVDDPALGEVIAVRSMVYLALTYDHRLVDGADAARYLVTVKSRLEEGSFEAELGL
ncbi:MAG TPA: 2-oxo acid dehydrogenase subunit E2 [Streptosporangiaceae bacterium]|nr:2-oxo acid dehydrogenase subunit E2 [Streptosporangiaceae bacterium]